MDLEEWWSKQSPTWRDEFDKAVKEDFKRSLVFGTPGQAPAFDGELLRKRWAELDAIEQQCPYDMLEEDYYQYLINMEHLHCGPHADDSPEGKWMRHYLTKKVLARR